MKTLIFILMALPYLAFSQHGIIKGTILVDTKNGDVPDVGAKIYVLEDKKISETVGGETIKLMSELNLAIAFLEDHELFKNTESDLTEDKIKRLNEMGIKTLSFQDVGYKKMENSGLMVCAQMRVNANHIETVSDGAGNFSFRVKPGNYYILIKSKKVISLHNRMEYDGSFYFDWFQVKAEEEAIKNAKFWLQDF